MALTSPRRAHAVPTLLTEVAGVAGAPRVRLGRLPTPLDRAGRLERLLGGPPLYVKRDDLTGFALGGNKVRKLEYLLAEALDHDSDVLVTGGGPGSNHCLTAAAAARVAGLDCRLILYGDPPTEAPPPLVLAKRFGAEVHFTGDPDRGSVDAALLAAADQLDAAGRHPFVVPRGGATPTGSLGYVQAVDELAAQLARHGVRPAVVLVATGSCGTHAGVLAGTIAAGLNWRVVGASVSRPLHECAERVYDLAAACCSRLGVRTPGEHEVVLRDARGAGFARPSPAAEAFAEQVACTEGLLLDPVYTAKAFAQLPAVVAEGVDGPVVVWHTGGTPSLLSEPHRAPGRSPA